MKWIIATLAVTGMLLASAPASSQLSERDYMRATFLAKTGPREVCGPDSCTTSPMERTIAFPDFGSSFDAVITMTMSYRTTRSVTAVAYATLSTGAEPTVLDPIEEIFPPSKNLSTVTTRWLAPDLSQLEMYQLDIVVQAQSGIGVHRVISKNVLVAVEISVP